MIKNKIICLLILITTPFFTHSQIFTIGPVLSWNFGDKQCKFSGGLEFGIYALPVYTENNKEAFLSLELGLDFEKGKNRFYSEFKLTKYIVNNTGLPFLYGISAGPVIEWGIETKTSLGFQSSAYGWFIIGANFKYRRIKGKNYYGPGMLIKIPFTFMRIDPGG